MALRKKPEAMKDKVNELWDEMISINGEGLVSIVRANRADIAEVKEDMAYVRGKVDGYTATTPPSKKKIILVRIAEVATVSLVLGLVIGAIILFIAGKLDADGIANILRAWKG